MLTSAAARETAQELYKSHVAEREALDLIRRYYVGRQRLPAVIPTGEPAEVRVMARASRVNVMRIVVNSLVQSMYVDGFRDSDDDSRNLDVWRVWQANRMDRHQTGIHRATAEYGTGYAVVLPGAPLPVIRGVSPRRLHAVYGEDPDWPLLALERLGFTNDRAQLWCLYDETHRYFLERKEESGSRDGATWTFVTSEVHGLEIGAPVVRFVDEDDLDSDDEVEPPNDQAGRAPEPWPLTRGQVGPLAALQDQIDLTTFDLQIAQHYAAFKQRYIIGWAAPSEAEAIKVSAQRLVTIDNEDDDTFDPNAVKVGEWAQSDLEGYLKSRDASLNHVASIAQLPLHELSGDAKLVNLPLALDTVVPVPGGRSTMGELKVGDRVFAPDGTTVEVAGLSPIYHGRECYRLRFDDGQEIVADAEHLWETSHFKSPHAAPYRYGRNVGVVTTRQIAETLKTCMGTNNHFIATAAAPDAPERDFAIQPYALGAWLGDGDENGAITQHVSDARELAALVGDGERVRVAQYSDGGSRYKVSFAHDFSRCPYGHERPRGTHDQPARCEECARRRYRLKRYGDPLGPRLNDSFQRRLKNLGVWRNKHIPEEYFHGSRDQRLALLQGIMDTDGSVSRDQGSVAITLHDRRLAADVHRLIMSLGHKVALREREWRNGLGSGVCWRMTWGAPDPVFRLGRKRAAQRTDFGGGDGKSSLPLRRYIVSCERVPPVPVRCIRVNSSAHLFCVTDAFIATHNSAEALAAAEASKDRKVGERQHLNGESHEQVFWACGQYLNVEVPADAEVRWRETSARSFAATVDGLGKLAIQLGVPPQELWERIPGVTQQDVERFKAAAKSGDAFANLTELLDRQENGNGQAFV